MTEVIRKKSGDPFFARSAVAATSSASGGQTFAPPVDAFFFNSSAAGSVVVTLANDGSTLTLVTNAATVYPFSLSHVSSATTSGTVIGLYTGSSTYPNA